MTTIRRWVYGRWFVPIVSGLLIIGSFIASGVAGSDFRGLDTSTLLADALMIAAAVVAGAPIVKKAVDALLIRHIGIDLLVSVAAIGAIIIGNYWEAA
ncbi:MAG TPA: cation-transporting P-type ATPase, partial [Candidatus Dietzia merdigallinarum]|nr:cation-transporting P-type ATPase [Candidatus Dietzia merdigallinarum]